MKNIIEVVWVQDSDRYIYIKRNMEGEFIELNFMQGEDSLKDVMVNNQNLFEFYRHCINNLELEERHYINLIDDIFWLWVKVNDKN